MRSWNVCPTSISGHSHLSLMLVEDAWYCASPKASLFIETVVARASGAQWYGTRRFATITNRSQYGENGASYSMACCRSTPRKVTFRSPTLS